VIAPTGPPAPAGTLDAVRRAGDLASTEGFGPGDHVAWGYEADEELDAVSVAFLRDGAAHGEQLLLVGDRSEEELRQRLRGADDLEALAGTDALRFVSVGDGYPPLWRDDPHEQVSTYERLTHKAQEAGYHGLRVAADVTTLVIEADDRDKFVQYEHLIDRQVAAGLAFSALCCYDRRRLGRSGFDELACVHPRSHGAAATASIHAGEAGTVELAGELDVFDVDGAATWARTFDRVLAQAELTTLTIDASRLKFIDHRGLVTLDAAAHSRELRIDLRGGSSVVNRVVELLELDAVHVSC
jgi:anti-anti-sigma regulatory factor